MTQIEAFLANLHQVRVVALLTLDGWRALSDGQVETVTECYGSLEYPPIVMPEEATTAQHHKGLIDLNQGISYQISMQPALSEGFSRTVAGYGRVLVNNLNDELSALWGYGGYSTTGMTALLELASVDPYGLFRIPILSGTGVINSLTDKDMAVEIQDQLSVFDRTIGDTTILAEDYDNPPPSSVGRTLNELWGQGTNLRATRVETATPLYALSVPNGLQSVSQIRTAGLPLGTSEYTLDFADPRAVLATFTADPGSNEITFDATGYKLVTRANATDAASIVGDMLYRKGGVSLSDVKNSYFSAFRSAYPQDPYAMEYVLKQQTTLGAMIDQFMSGLPSVLYYAPGGEWRIEAFAAPTGSASEEWGDDIENLGQTTFSTIAPLEGVRIAYGQTGAVQQRGSLAAADTLSVADREYYIAGNKHTSWAWSRYHPNVGNAGFTLPLEAFRKARTIVTHLTTEAGALALQDLWLALHGVPRSTVRTRFPLHPLSTTLNAEIGYRIPRLGLGNYDPMETWIVTGINGTIRGAEGELEVSLWR